MRSRSIPLGIAVLAALLAVSCGNPLVGAKQAPEDGDVSARYLQRYSYLPCNGVDQGYDLPGIDAQQMSGTFRLELVFSVAANQTQAYADIIDVNHRSNIGLVVQQDGTNNNEFLFAAGDGSQMYCIKYACKPGRYYAAVFEKTPNGGLTLDICEAASLDSCNVMRATYRVATMAMRPNAYFLPGSYPTLGYNKNYGRYFNGAIYLAKFYQCAGSAESVRFDGTPAHSGNPAVSGDPASKMKGDFVVEMGLRNELAQNDYATIMDVNHRDNVGVVIQQNGSIANNYVFGIGFGGSAAVFTYDLQGAYYHDIEFRRDGSYLSLADRNDIVKQLDTGYSGQIYFLPGSTATVGYNANYGRYFNGLISYAYIWTPLAGSN